MYIIELFWPAFRYAGRMSGKKIYKLESVPVIIRKFRNMKNLSQDQVGERMGVTGNFISRLELGHEYPSIGMLIRIAKALGVTSGDMMNAIEAREDAKQSKDI